MKFHTRALLGKRLAVSVKGQRLTALCDCLEVAWRKDIGFFSLRERAALAWTEAVTLLAQSQVPDDVYGLARASFSEEELVDLTLAISTINSWNRLR